MMQAYTGGASGWNALIARLPGAHFLQTWDWAQVKSAYGWKPMPLVWQDKDEIQAAAMILKRQVISRGFAARLCILYCPKGPLMDWANESLRAKVLDDLQDLARKQGAIFLKLDPDVLLGTGIPGGDGASEDRGGEAVVSELKQRGWVYSSDQIQFKNTFLVDLSAPDEEMMARMKQKTRYNVRLAEKKGVSVRVGTKDDLETLYKMYAETSARDGFVIREEKYYRTVWEAFMSSGEPACEPLIAEVDREPVAAIFLFYFAGRAWYVYGMSREAHREKMPNYLLQWEAMRRAKARGSLVYDLWGAPDEFNEGDSLWGVFRFKEGLGGEVVRTLGAWDFAPNRFWYKTYSEIIPRLLDIMRSRGKQKTKQEIGGL
jgi:lipid II:glycine glycyltransferase (peptidoglycan interpeptide bridge formation enzyme)